MYISDNKDNIRIEETLTVTQVSDQGKAITFYAVCHGSMSI